MQGQNQEFIKNGIAAEIKKLSKATGLSDDPLIPSEYLRYFYLAGLLSNFDVCVKDFQDESSEDIPASWKAVPNYLKEHFVCELWTHAFCDEMDLLFRDQVHSIDDVPEEYTKKGSLNGIIYREMKQSNFIACFSEEPDLSLRYAYICAIYFCLYLDISNKTKVTLFQKIGAYFSIDPHGDTITKINEWSQDNKRIPQTSVAAFCYHILSKTMLERDSYGMAE